MLTVEERERVAEAIRQAESRTAGEIVVVVAARASAYRSMSLLYALAASLALPWPLIFGTAVSASRIFLAQLAVVLVVLAALSWPRLRLALVPQAIKRARGREAAAREFATHGLSRTAGRTGVLIYVAAAEHYAEVVADTGIADRVDEHVWRETITDLVEAIRAGRAADGLVAAVNRVGEILVTTVPPRNADENELPNKVILA